MPTLWKHPLLVALLAALLVGVAFGQDRTIIIAVPSDIQNLDPTLSSGDTLTQEVLTSVYSFLIDFERVQDADGQWIGNADAFVPPERVEAFKAAMNEAGVNYVFHGYDGVRHGFTNPDAGSFGLDNLVYDEAADEASWRSMLQTINTVF